MPITHGWITAQSDDPAYDVSADELNDHSGTEDHGHTATGDGGLLAAGAPTGADYLVGTANGGLSAEIVVGTSPNGELGGSWSSITVDATHSGSTHAATQAAAESTAASALSGHVAAGDPHTGYRLESAAIVEGDLSTSDITTANATTSKHGFVPKLPNDATKYYDGTGAYTVPAGGGSTFYGANAIRTTTQSISDSTVTAVGFDSETAPGFDVGTVHDTVTNNSRFTVPTGGAGKWTAVGGGVWDNNGSGALGRYIWWRLNGTTDIPGSGLQLPGNSNGRHMQAICPAILLADADYVEMVVYQDSAGTRAFGAASLALGSASASFWKVG